MDNSKINSQSATKCCIKCGKTIPAKAKFCTECSASQIQAPPVPKVRKCINNHIMGDTDKFCPECGKPAVVTPSSTTTSGTTTTNNTYNSNNSSYDTFKHVIGWVILLALLGFVILGYCSNAYAGTGMLAAAALIGSWIIKAFDLDM